MAALAAELNSVAGEVALAVGDWQPMLAKLNEIIDELPKRKHPVSKEEVASCVAFLKWVAAHNFTLMGYRRYDVKAVEGDHEILPQASSSLGLMKNSIKEVGQRLGNMPASARHAALSSDLLILTKSNSKSRVHRPAYVDYIGIKRFDEHGKVMGKIASSASTPLPSTTPARPRSRSSAIVSNASWPPPVTRRAPTPTRRC